MTGLLESPRGVDPGVGVSVRKTSGGEGVGD